MDSDDDLENETCKNKFKRWYYTYINIVRILQAVCILLQIILLWLIAYSIWGEEVGIRSDPVALLVLFTAAKALGYVFQFIKIPSILGMIAMGVILKNVGYLNLSKRYLTVAGYLRKITLLSILLPAAFSMDPTILRQMCVLIFTIATIPTLIEIISVFLLSHYVLDLPWLWALLNGFVMGAEAPAIIIPCLFILEEKGYGNVDGVHTLATAVCILNVIESVTFFGLVFGFLTVKTDNAMESILKGPTELVIGIGYGVTLGLVAEFIPHYGDWYVATLRTIFITFGSLLSFFGSQAIGYDGAGVLGCFCLAFVANLRWRKQGWYRHNPVRENFKLAWKFFEPISFSLIGMEVDFNKLKIYDLGIGSIVMLAGCMCHFGGALIVKFFKFTWGQTIFIAITCISKATVQAALGPLALDFARETDASPEIVKYAQTILSVSVVAIIITSSLCTILLVYLGPKLLPLAEVHPDDSLRKSRLVLITEPDHSLREENRRFSSRLMENEQNRERERFRFGRPFR